MKNMINQRKAGVILSYAGELVKILVSLIYTPIIVAPFGTKRIRIVSVSVFGGFLLESFKFGIWKFLLTVLFKV